MRCFDKIIRNYFIMLGCVLLILMVYFGAQTMPPLAKPTAYQSSIFKITLEGPIEPVIDIPEETTTTTSTTVVVTTTVPETTTTSVVVKTTLTTKVTTTTVPVSQTVVVYSDGPPRNTTTLVGCIAYYESTWGKDPNVFQFTQSTWEQYGGTGSPSNAPYWRQEEVFWLAWEDAGKHHWAAQKGRCF